MFTVSLHYKQMITHGIICAGPDFQILEYQLVLLVIIHAYVRI